MASVASPFQEDERDGMWSHVGGRSRHSWEFTASSVESAWSSDALNTCMTSAYRINYHLRAHKRDPLIEFIKGMLMTPFLLHSKPREKPLSSDDNPTLEEGAESLTGKGLPTFMDDNLRRYTEIMRNVEEMINVSLHGDRQALGVEQCVCGVGRSIS